MNYPKGIEQRACQSLAKLKLGLYLPLSRLNSLKITSYEEFFSVTPSESVIQSNTCWGQLIDGDHCCRNPMLMGKPSALMARLWTLAAIFCQA